MTPSTREKVAVLGGGPAAVTAAFQLTAPELNDRFEVTIYQPGWRLGGKCASGRNMAPNRGARIEEHGLHVWFGFYDNAFSVMRKAYEELERPAGHPLPTLEDAFKGCDEIVLYDRQDKGWIPLSFNPLPNDLVPGEPHGLPSFWDIAKWMCDWALRRYPEVKSAHPKAFSGIPSSGPATQSHWHMIVAALRGAGKTPAPAGPHLLVHASSLARDAQALGTHQLPRALAAPAPDFEAVLGKSAELVLVDLLCLFRDWLWDAVVSGRVKKDPHLRLFFTIFDTFVSATAGIVKDGVLERGWEAINDYDLCQWLEKHGAKQVTLGATPAERSPLLRSIYDVAFGYPEGDIAKANVAAGTAMSDLLRMTFSYRGSLMYKMQAGMGDTVLAPFYLALKKRGVKFDFFSAVTGLGMNKAGDRIEKIDVVRQVDLLNPTGDPPYEPLIDVDGLECWPSAPLWDQLAEGEKLRNKGYDFEHEPNPLGREPEPLKRGKDFDHVVLGIPVGALGDICKELSARIERFDEMLKNSVTVSTQAFQLWLSKKPTELGSAGPENSVAGSYMEPIDTWCDMTHLLGRERWGAADGVAGLAYFCGVLDERPKETPADATERVKGNAEAFLAADVGAIWPKATVRGGPGLDWSMLADPERTAPGPDRLASQYWRANVTPSERYVLTPAGSVRHRLRADELKGTVKNLVLAGDWTRNGIDGGCVESAVASGMQAAQALIGEAHPLVGESPKWLSERHGGPVPKPAAPPGSGRASAPMLPKYVEYGGRATAPPPFLSTGGRFRGMLLKGDESLIADLIERMLNVPAAGKAVYRPLFGEHVLLQTGAFAKVSSQAPDFDNWGYVEEAQISLWIPVTAGHLHGSVFVAERLCLAVPFILVNNPMSYAGGREDYGYPKSLGIFSPTSGMGDPMTVEAFGGKFAPGNRADWHKLFELSRASTAKANAPSRSFELHELRQRLGKIRKQHRLVLPDLSLLEDFLAALTGKQTRQVFLKQFRDVEATTNAVYQAVVEAPIHFLSTSVKPSLEEWQVEIAELDSHPIGRELGVFSQPTRFTFEVAMDMIAEPGRVIAP
jgi:uncharacterized protein with NAD-binding domain and iron-sulfur cluster